MPIDVLCPGCKTRFQVSDKFAGKKGPCPKCKAVIQVPDKGPEIVVHAPEASGPKDSKGQAVLKPLKRVDTKVTPLRIGLAVGIVVIVLGAALYFRLSTDAKDRDKNFPLWPLIAGALMIAPLTSWSGYAFLRDDELEPYAGRGLILRVAICSLAYAILWGVYYGVKISLLDGKPPATFELIYVAPPLIAVGGAIGWGCFDLSYGTGMLHYGYFLIVTIILRKIVGLAIL